MSSQFRKLLQQFYVKINNSAFLDVYKKILIDQLDQAEVEPIHIIQTSEKPSMLPKTPKNQKKRLQQLYKNTDFASVFLFAFMLNLLKRKQEQYTNQIKQKVNANLQNFYPNKQNQDYIRMRFIFNGFFQFYNLISTHNYQIQQIQKLFKAFYANTLQRKGLRKNQREKYLTQAQTVLSFILSTNNTFPSKRQLSEPTSDAYQYNNLQFSINIQNLDERQQWTIGQGQNQINIGKQKFQYFVYEQIVNDEENIQDQLNSNWVDILGQSEQIRKMQSDKTRQLFQQLNIDQMKSPTKSTRPARSVHFRQGVNKLKLGDIF